MNLKRPMLFTGFFLATLLAIALTSAWQTLVTAAPVQALKISAAISLRPAFLEIQQVFEQQNPNLTMQFNFGASGVLRQQIEQGAEIDIFISADAQNMDRLEQKAQISKTSRFNLARNQLAIALPISSSKSISQVADLKNLDRIAIGNLVTVPAGIYAKQALTQAGIFADLERANKIIYGENVRQVLTYVEQGNVDAGLVYVTDAIASTKAKIGLRLPLAITSPIVYPIALLTRSKNPQSAQKFLDFLRLPTAQKILQKYGFLPS